MPDFDTMHSPQSPSWQCLVQATPQALLSAQEMADVLRRLRWQATDTPLRGGALFDGERLVVLAQGDRQALASAVRMLAEGAPRLDWHVLYESEVLVMPGQPVAQAAAWQLAFVEPGRLADEPWAMGPDGQTPVSLFRSLLTSAAGE